MFGEINNDMRAASAAKAVEAFQRATLTDDSDALSDLLCNLMHWADQSGQDFAQALNRGASHYQSEVEIEEKQDNGEEVDPSGLGENLFHFVRVEGPAPVAAATE